MSNKLRVRVIKLFKWADWTIVVITFFFLVFACSMFFWAESGPMTKPFMIRFRELMVSISPDLTAASLLFLVSFILLRKYDAELAEQRDENLVENIAQRMMALQGGMASPVEMYNNFNDIQWRDLLQKAKRIDICAQYCASWISNFDKDFGDFFAKGGKARLIVPNYDNLELVNWIARRSVRRANNGTDRVRRQIEDTYLNLEGIWKRCGSGSASFEGMRVEHPLMYTAVRFDDDTLILAWYENVRDHGTNWPGGEDLPSQRSYRFRVV